MLKNIKIDGFKSLSDFSFDIMPGLNVLVGTNGSGKTTIIRAFEFLSNIVVFRLSDAISRSGGASEVFDISRKKHGDIEPQYLKISCSGEGIETVRSRNNIQKKYNVNYNFAATIMFDAANAEVAYTNQSLSLKVILIGKQKQIVHINVNWDPNKIEIIKDNDVGYVDIFGDDSVNYVKYLESRAQSFHVYALTSQIFFFRQVYQRIVKDISFGKSFNIIPDNVKKDEDIASSPHINPDGSGLAATLFHVMRPDRDEDNNFFFESYRPRYDKDMLKKINELLRLVNDNIHDITVTPNYTENKLAIYALINGEGEEFKVPLRYLSDGTVKWLALSAAILSRPWVFILEEPENFLHPKMLFEAIELMRSTFRESKDRFIILSSHSETLLNLVHPEEIVVVSYTGLFTSLIFRFKNLFRGMDLCESMASNRIGGCCDVAGFAEYSA